MLLSKGTKAPPNQLSEALLAEHRPVLFRYALLQLRDNELADDAVQETLLAAWQVAGNPAPRLATTCANNKGYIGLPYL